MVYPAPVTDGPEHDARGLFIGGPKLVTPSDIIARLIEEAKGSLPDVAVPPNIVEQRRAMRIYSARHAQRQRERRAQTEAAA